MSGSDEMARRIGFVMALRARGLNNTRVLSAIERVPRSLFVAPEFADIAYAERHLPLICGQTIERPSHVARIIDALNIEEQHKVLEIGTGSGWQTAIMARLAREVVSLERFRGLSSFAAHRMGDLEIHNCELRLADGLVGAADLAPFDRIVVNGSLSEVPRKLIDQLAMHGVLILALGQPDGRQELMRYARSPAGTIRMSLGAVRCGPIIRGVAKAS